MAQKKAKKKLKVPRGRGATQQEYRESHSALCPGCGKDTKMRVTSADGALVHIPYVMATIECTRCRARWICTYRPHSFQMLQQGDARGVGRLA